MTQVQHMVDGGGGEFMSKTVADEFNVPVTPVSAEDGEPEQSDAADGLDYAAHRHEADSSTTDSEPDPAALRLLASLGGIGLRDGGEEKPRWDATQHQ